MRHGLTLIELMAVIVLIALAAGTAAYWLSAVHEDVELRSAAEAVQSLDRKARLQSQTGTRVLLSVATQHHASLQESTSVLLIDLADRSILGRVDLPRNSQATLETSNGERHVVFDRTGRSSDYSVSLARAEHAIEWRVRGATGERKRKETSR